MAQRASYHLNKERTVTQARQFLQEQEEERSEEKEGGAEHPLTQRFLKTRTILISGEIDKTLAERVVKHLILLEAEDDQPIRVFIDSPGGDADAGFALFDMIRFVKPEVYIVGMGLVASAAALILLASPAKFRVGFVNSSYLIHQPLSGMRGVATEIEIHARQLERMRLRINEVISEQTGQDLAKVEKDTDRDYWMTSEEAVEYGLLSRVISSRDDL